MQEFMSRIAAHVEHVKKVAQHCTGEETTKQALILPLLDILGFHPYDPTRVRAEFASDFPGVKASERVDYALFCDGHPVMFIEAKAHSEKLNNHCPQLARYFNATPSVTMAVITNGQEWRFFTDLVEKNIMDEKPFLKIDLVEGPAVDLTDAHRAEIVRVGLEIGAGDQVIIDRPENLHRLAGILFDCLAYCQNDDNFARGSRSAEPA